MTTLSTSQNLTQYLEQLICVTKPYFALKNFIILDDHILQAEIEVENLTHGEATLISGAEAGRHLAILGSCALALQNPIESKHYYLANQANIERGFQQDKIVRNHHTYSNNLIVQARVIALDLANKKGKVETCIMTPQGETIFNLEVSYQVLKNELFQKLFRRAYIEDAVSGNNNPYVKTIDINISNFGEQILSGNLGVISSAQCVGHFDHYPALPIAILSGALSKLAAMHLKLMLKNNELVYTIKHATLAANQLAFAGEQVFVHSTFISSSKGEYTFFAKATNAQSDELGTIEVSFELMKDAMNTSQQQIHYFPFQKREYNQNLAF